MACACALEIVEGSGLLDQSSLIEQIVWSAVYGARAGFHLATKIWGGSTINECMGIFSIPSSLGRMFRRISLIPPDCFG